MNCPVGTYLNVTLGDCLDCSKGYYQENEAATMCQRCPVGMSTADTKTQNSTDCKGKHTVWGEKQNAERLCFFFVKVPSLGRYSQILNEKSAPVLKLGLPFCRLKESKKVDLH